MAWPSRADGMTRRALAQGAAALSLAACGGAERERPLSAFEGFLADLAAGVLADSPELATSLGFVAGPDGTAYAARLDARSALSVEIRRTATERRAAQAAAFATERLNADERTTLAAVRAWLDAASAGARFAFGRFDGLGRFSPYVFDPDEAAFVALPRVFDDMAADTGAAALEAVVARLRATPAALGGEVARAIADARSGFGAPDFVLARAQQRLDVLLATPIESSAFARALARAGQASAREDQAWRARMLAEGDRLIRRDIATAYARTAEALRRLRDGARQSAGVGGFADGEAYYAAALAAESGLATSADEVFAAASARAQEAAERLDMTLRGLGLTEGAPGPRAAALALDPRFAWPEAPAGDAAVVAALSAEQERLRERSDRWSPRFKPPALEVIAAPGSGGVAYRAAAIGGERAAALLVDPAALRATPRFGLTILAARHATPGRHLQASRAHAAQDLPLIRRIVPAAGFERGWAAYAEELADEAGFFENDAFGRVGFLLSQLRRATCAALDVALHVRGLSRGEAVASLVATVGDGLEQATATVDRIAARPGEAASAELGRMTLVRLREETRAEMGARFDIAGFHDAALSGGSLPLPVLSARLRRIAQIA